MENKKVVQTNQYLIDKDKLLEAGVQFGHKTHKWNPAMKPFIHNTKDNSHIINLSRTLLSLKISYEAIKKISSMGGTLLFVGTNKQSSSTVKLNAIRTGSYYVNQRWLGGTLTNFKTILNSIKKLRYLERLEKNNFNGYTKKEALNMKRKLDKLEKSLGGIKYMRKPPAGIFVTSVIDEKIVIKEANKLDIPVFGIVDTNANPRSVKFPIFANDDANKSVSLITTFIADAVAEAKGDKRYVANVPSSEFKILGLNQKNEAEALIRKNLNSENTTRNFEKKSNNDDIKNGKNK